MHTKKYYREQPDVGTLEDGKSMYVVRYGYAGKTGHAFTGGNGVYQGGD
jgi:hypothetical protein